MIWALQMVYPQGPTVNAPSENLRSSICFRSNSSNGCSILKIDNHLQQVHGSGKSTMYSSCSHHKHIYRGFSNQLLWKEEILHQLVDGLSHYDPIIYSVHRNSNSHQLVQDFATIHSMLKLSSTKIRYVLDSL